MKLLQIPQIFGLFGSIYAALSIALGAFGAHALKEKLSSSSLLVFETATRYLMTHALALILVSLLSFHQMSRWLSGAGYCFIVGSIFFSGSLYVIALTHIKVLGPFTPIGGLVWICGWVLCIIHFISQ